MGVPIVSSDVGGVSSLMKHQVDGYLYPADVSSMLAYYIQEVFMHGKPNKADYVIESNTFLDLYNRESICRQLLETYDDIIKKEKE